MDFLVFEVLSIVVESEIKQDEKGATLCCWVHVCKQRKKCLFGSFFFLYPPFAITFIKHHEFWTLFEAHNCPLRPRRTSNNLSNENKKKQVKRDRPIRPKLEDRINKNHKTKYFWPYNRINRKPDDQIYLFSISRCNRQI